MVCCFVRVLLRFSGDSARSVTVAASNAVQASRIDKAWNMGLLIRSWQRSRVEELISLNGDSAERGYLRVSRTEEKACHPTTRLSRLASPRKGVARARKEDPMNNKKNVRKIGASFIFTLALIG